MKKVTSLKSALEILSTKLNFTSVDSDRITADNGASIHIDTKLHGTRNKYLPSIQVVVSLVIKDRRVWSWGSENNADNDMIIDWYNDLKTTVRNKVDDDQDIACKNLLKEIGL